MWIPATSRHRYHFENRFVMALYSVAVGYNQGIHKGEKRTMADRHNPEHYTTSLRMQANNGRLLEMLAKRLGVPKNTVVVLGLQALAKEHGIPINAEESAGNDSA
jgi:hypothetical protein